MSILLENGTHGAREHVARRSAASGEYAVGGVFFLNANARTHWGIFAKVAKAEAAAVLSVQGTRLKCVSRITTANPFRSARHFCSTRTDGIGTRLHNQRKGLRHGLLTGRFRAVEKGTSRFRAFELCRLRHFRELFDRFLVN